MAHSALLYSHGSWPDLCELLIELSINLSEESWVENYDAIRRVGYIKVCKLGKGKRNRKVVLDNYFWRRLEKLQRTVMPLVELLRLVDSEKEMMGLIFDAIDITNLTIAEVHGNNKEKFMKYWNIVDERLESTLHSPLHATGYFLNPSLRSRPEFSEHLEVRRGLRKVLLTLERDEDKQIEIF